MGVREKKLQRERGKLGEKMRDTDRYGWRVRQKLRERELFREYNC